MTLLRRDIKGIRYASQSQDLNILSQLRLVGADVSALTIHGSAHVSLELGVEKQAVEALIVSPLTAEAIIGLD